MQGTASLASLIDDKTNSGNVDPARLTAAVSSALPWARNVVNSLATVANTATGIYNNSSMYMKALTQIMTQERIFLSGIPLPAVDLHRAPVTFMTVQPDVQWQEQYTLIRRNIEAGSIVLVEGRDWTRADVVNIIRSAVHHTPLTRQILLCQLNLCGGPD